MDGKQIVIMRMDGRTFQEIADFYGVSKQAVHTKLKSYTKILEGERGRAVDGRRFNINSIPYKGLYEYFKENEEETVSSFSRKVSGAEYRTNFACKMRNFLIGENDSYFTIVQIKKICKIIGKSFEEAFEEREEIDGERKDKNAEYSF